MSGAFAALTESVKGTFSPIYDWAAELAGGARETGADPRSQAPKVSSYQLVMGKRMGPVGR
jgi:hypothetical protein